MTRSLSKDRCRRLAEIHRHSFGGAVGAFALTEMTFFPYGMESRLLRPSRRDEAARDRFHYQWCSPGGFCQDQCGRCAEPDETHRRSRNFMHDLKLI